MAFPVSNAWAALEAHEQKGMAGSVLEAALVRFVVGRQMPLSCAHGPVPGSCQVDTFARLPHRKNRERVGLPFSQQQERDLRRSYCSHRPRKNRYTLPIQPTPRGCFSLARSDSYRFDEGPQNLSKTSVTEKRRCERKTNDRRRRWQRRPQGRRRTLRAPGRFPRV